MRTPTISLFSTPLNLEELVTSTAFDGCMGIQSTNEMDVCCPNHSFRPEPRRKGVISNKVFLLLIPKCSDSSLMLPIGTSEVGLTHNTQPLGVTFRSILESKNGNIVPEVALIEDTRQKGLFYFKTSPSTSVDFFNFPELRVFLLRER